MLLNSSGEKVYISSATHTQTFDKRSRSSLFSLQGKHTPLSKTNTMPSKRQTIVLWLLFVTFMRFGECCGPAEIGQQYVMISTTANVQSDAWVAWLLSGNLVYDSFTSFRNAYPDSYAGTRTQLTILNVTKQDGTAVFTQLIDGIFVYTCTLPVYKRASIPTCEPITLIGNQMRTKCTTAEVFPWAKCQFTLRNEGTGRRYVTDGTPYITYDHTDPQPNGNEYYSTSCTLQYPVDGLELGDWAIYVNMYPDLTGVSLDQGTVGHAVNSLLLYPTTTTAEITTPAQTTTPSILARTEVDVSNICSANNWADGSYSHPSYIQCNNGKTSILTCPNNLVFNKARGMCDNP